MSAADFWKPFSIRQEPQEPREPRKQEVKPGLVRRRQELAEAREREIEAGRQTNVPGVRLPRALVRGSSRIPTPPLFKPKERLERERAERALKRQEQLVRKRKGSEK